MLNEYEVMEAENLRSAIPPQAEDVLDEDEGHAGRRWKCILDGRIVGYRYRHDDVLSLEFGVDAEGRVHGLQREWYEAGALSFESYYVHGLEHGVARQYSHDGRLIGTYRMQYGTGLDLWRDESGALSEERYLQDGNRHGFERWWKGDDRAVWEEGHYWLNLEHGIFRIWNHQGRLRRGYPQYYTNGKRVTKRQYLKACASDPTLPPFNLEDNRPERQLPTEHLKPGQ